METIDCEDSTEELARLKFRCRRGMLELDYVFQQFFNRCYLQLERAQQLAFKQLLDCEEADLRAWLIDGYDVTNDSVKDIVTLMKQQLISKDNA